MKKPIHHSRLRRPSSKCRADWWGMLECGLLVRLVGLVGRGQAVGGSRSCALGTEATSLAPGKWNEDQVRWIQRALGRKGRFQASYFINGHIVHSPWRDIAISLFVKRFRTAQSVPSFMSQKDTYIYIILVSNATWEENDFFCFLILSFCIIFAARLFGKVTAFL